MRSIVQNMGHNARRKFLKENISSTPMNKKPGTPISRHLFFQYSDELNAQGLTQFQPRGAALQFQEGTACM